MKEKLILGFKGFLIGIANIIPGVSGGTMAVSFGIYEQLISIASTFTKNIKKNIAFILPIGIGAVLAIGLLSNIITICLNNYKVATPLLFVGLILGGVPVVFKKVNKEIVKSKNLLSFLITLIFMGFIYLGVSEMGNVSFTDMNIMDYVLLFIVGVVAAVTMVVPGVSGSFVLMLIGYYEPIVETISNLTRFKDIFSNCLIIFPFGIGVLAGIVSISKLIKYCLKHYEIQTYSSILAFVVSSIVLIIYPLFSVTVSNTEITIGIVLMLLGTILTYKLEK